MQSRGAGGAGKHQEARRWRAQPQLLASPAQAAWHVEVSAHHVRSSPLFLMALSTAPMVSRPALVNGADGTLIWGRSVRNVEKS